MTERLSQRLKAILEALPLSPCIRVLEVGCGPGALTRAMSSAIGSGYVLGIDRSDRAVAQAIAGSKEQIAAGRLSFRTVAAEDFVMGPGEAPFDLVVAVRVGALDGRHPRPALAPGREFARRLPQADGSSSMALRYLRRRQGEDRALHDGSRRRRIAPDEPASAHADQPARVPGPRGTMAGGRSASALAWLRQ